MSTSPVSRERASLLELIAAGDPDAAAGFYDGRAPSVREYCAQICPTEQVDEATLAAFVDFLGRVGAALADADPDDLLRKSTRTAAASRMQLSEPHEPTCRSIPELIAARANGELPHNEEPINKHLERCATCRHTAERLAEAEDALIRTPTSHPPEHVRERWLQIGSRGDAAESAAPPVPVEAFDQPITFELADDGAAQWVTREPGEQEATADGAQPPAEPELQPPAEPELQATAEPEQVAREEQERPAPQQPEQLAPEQAEPDAALAPAQPIPATPPPAEAPEPAAAAQLPDPSPLVIRRRSGGLVGAARRIASPARGKGSQ